MPDEPRTPEPPREIHPRDEDQTEEVRAPEGHEDRRRKRDMRFRDLARRILTDRPPQERVERPDKREPAERDLQDAARDAIFSILETGDRAKTEVVRLMAREFRSYLTEMKVGEGLHHLITNYSLEVNASLHLKPLPKEAVKVEKAEKVAHPDPDAGSGD